MSEAFEEGEGVARKVFAITMISTVLFVSAAFVVVFM